MKYLVRFLKLLIVGIFSILIGIPFAALMMIISIFSIIPLFIFLYIKTGDAEKSSDTSFDISMETIWCEIGYAPLMWISKILKD